MHPLAFRSFSRHFVCASKNIVPRPDRRECWVEVYEPFKYQTASEIKKWIRRSQGEVAPLIFVLRSKKWAECNSCQQVGFFNAYETEDHPLWREGINPSQGLGIGGLEDPLYTP